MGETLPSGFRDLTISQSCTVEIPHRSPGSQTEFIACLRGAGGAAISVRRSRRGANRMSNGLPVILAEGEVASRCQGHGGVETIMKLTRAASYAFHAIAYLAVQETKEPV